MKSKLKNLILLFAFSAFTCNTFAQTEWITELPVFGYAYSMLRTKDSCYAVLKRPAYYNERFNTVHIQPTAYQSKSRKRNSVV